MNITDNLIRIKEGKDNIIKSLKNKGVSINDDTLINEIPTIIDNAEIGGGGDTPSQPETPELVPKYDGASVFRIEVPNDNYEFAINLCNDATKATYDVDWGDGVLESGLTTDEQHHIYSKKGIYDVNIYNISKDITLGGKYEVKFGSGNSDKINIYYLFNNTNNDYWGNRYIYNKDNYVTNVLIGNSVTSIGSYAFYICSSLQSVVIGNSVTSIESYAFSNCRSLQSVLIPEGVKIITSNVFYYCYSLQSVVIPDSVTSIETYAFGSCYSLQSVVIPDNVTSIGSYAFSNCRSLQSVVIPDSVTSIETYAFNGCYSLQSVVIPEGVKIITTYAFNNCTSLQSVVIPDSVTSIESNAFNGCSSLQSVVIGNSVTSIESYAFNQCSSLQSVVIPDSVTSIETYAFGSCSSLQSVVIPDSVTSIDNSIFYNCSSLQSVVIGNNVTKFSYNIFQDCTSLQSIVIPEWVTIINPQAFYNCSSLQSVVIPEGVKIITSNVFYNCSSLQSVVIPDSVTSIESNAFGSCYSLQSVVIPDNVTSIGSYAFQNCTALQSIFCYALTSPTIQTNSFPTSNLKYTKRYLYVPKDSTGYDSGNWKTLIDKGWELRYIEDREKTPTTLKLKTKNNFFHNLQAIGQANLINYELINDEYIYNFDDKITEIFQYTFYGNVLEEIELPECVEILGKSAFSGSTYLNSITCKSMTSPTIQTDTFPSSIGSSVPSDTPKVLRVPEGATGYDSGNWKSYVLDKGYTLEYFKL